jgi:hypothetical protein
MVVDALIAPSHFRSSEQAPLTTAAHPTRLSPTFLPSALTQTSIWCIADLVFITSILVWAHDSAEAGLAIRSSFTLLVLDSINRADITRMSEPSLEHASQLSPTATSEPTCCVTQEALGVMKAARTAPTGQKRMVALQVNDQPKHAFCNLDTNRTAPACYTSLDLWSICNGC